MLSYIRHVNNINGSISFITAITKAVSSVRFFCLKLNFLYNNKTLRLESSIRSYILVRGCEGSKWNVSFLHLHFNRQSTLRLDTNKKFNSPFSFLKKKKRNTRIILNVSELCLCIDLPWLFYYLYCMVIIQMFIKRWICDITSKSVIGLRQSASLGLIWLTS